MLFGKRIKGFIFRRFKRAVYEMAKSAEKEDLNATIDQILGLLRFKGRGIHINGSITIKNPHNVSIGNNVHIGQNAFFQGYGGLTIEDNAHISRNVTIYTYSHQYNGEVLPYDTGMIVKPVHIEKNVWIGMNVSIIPGVTIGEGAIVGMGTIVSGDIPPMAVVGSPPFRIIKYRDKSHYVSLEKTSRYGGVGGKPLASAQIQQFKRQDVKP
jgi:acetyltransferase-like isoleucine patch superfamily enzyme